MATLSFLKWLGLYCTKLQEQPLPPVYQLTKLQQNPGFQKSRVVVKLKN